MKKYIVFVCFFMCSEQVLAAKDHACSQHAVAHAKALLMFHRGGIEDLRMLVPSRATTLKPIMNYANLKQMYDVLEVRGNINKGNYRMRFTYLQSKDLVLDDKCVLVGQEVMEETKEGEF